MLRKILRAVCRACLCACLAFLFLVSASAADTAYLIYSHTDITRSIFAVSNAMDQSPSGILTIQEDFQNYTIPIYRASSGCTVTVQGSAAQLRVFPVDVIGTMGSVRWPDELSPEIGKMQVTLAEGVQSIPASDFRNYIGRLTGGYTYEVGAGFRLTDVGSYLVSHSDGGMMPSSVIVQVSGAGGISSGSTVGDLPASSGLFGPTVAQSVSATQNSAPVLINGKRVTFDAYTINEGTYGYTYFKLRDLAAALSGTEKQYEVMWDKTTESVLLLSGMPYTMTGGELAARSPGKKTAKLSHSYIYKDGMPASLTAYVIGQNNYFKLRDIAQLFNFSADWDNDAMCIVIDTSKPYTGN